MSLLEEATKFPLKAKTMAQAYESEPTIETVASLMKAMQSETAHLIRTRGIKHDAALKPLFREQDDKWRALARRCPDLRPDAYRVVSYVLHEGASTYVWGPLTNTETETS